METTNESSPESPVPAEPMSLGSRLFNVFSAPRDVFESVRAAEMRHTNWIVPILILLVVSWVGTAVIFSQPHIKRQVIEMQEKAIDQQVAQGKIPKEKAEEIKVATEKYAGIGVQISAYVGTAFISFASPFWWALLTWLVGAKFLKGSFDYLKALEISGLAGMIGVLAGIVKTLMILVTGSLFANAGPVLLLKEFDSTNALHSVVAVFDLMTFWELVVRAVGLACLARVSFGKAVAWVFGLWAAVTGTFMGIGFAAQAIFGGLK